MQGFQLYAFQRKAADIGEAALLTKRNEVICLPTGAGKSVVIAEIVRRLSPDAKTRILIVTHVRELVEQNVAALRKHLPEFSIGTVCSGLSKFEWSSQVIVGTIQSLYMHPFASNFAALIIDECHLVRRDEQSMYRKLVNKLRDKRPTLPVLGLSATPYRLDSGYLHDGDDRLFTRIAYDVPVPDLLRNGVLSPLVGAPVQHINLTNLARGGDEFKVSTYTDVVQSWMEDTAKALDSVMALAANRNKWLVFTCSIKHAQAVASYLNERGVTAWAVHNKMKLRDRDLALQKFRSGETKVIVNVNVLTTGFDVPSIDCIVMLRPTLSTGLYVQMLGRGMRKHEGKTDCMVLDFVDNVGRHGALTDIVPQFMRPLDTNGAASSGGRECPECSSKVSTFAMQCPYCNHLFAKISSKASEESVTHVSIKLPIVRNYDTSETFLSTECVAAMISVTPGYVKQMRHYDYGPPYLRTGGMTQKGWREIVYRAESVKHWMKLHPDKTQYGAKQVKRRRKPDIMASRA